jgi:hypothetical protein
LNFREYPKIHRLGKEETDGILNGPVTVQEKVDGANISIWLGDDGEVHCGSRGRELPSDDVFNGFPKYVRSNEKIKDFLLQNPTMRLYGEWLVKHTITYPETAYRKIYLFDLFDDAHNYFYEQSEVQKLAKDLGLEFPHIFVDARVVTIDDIKEFVGKSMIPNAARGEGVVIKPLDFKNKWGDHVYAKMVHEQFKEANAIVFGGNNKNSETYHEMYFVNKFATLGRVQKIMNKLQPELNKRLDMHNTSEIVGRCVHDMFTEEAWEMLNRGWVLDTKKLKSLATRKFIQIYHDILNNSISVADNGVGGDAAA